VNTIPHGDELARRDRSIRAKRYWAKVRAGELPKPTRKPGGAVKRRTRAEADGRNIIVEIHPEGLLRLRLAGCRYFYDLPIKTAWVYAAMLSAAEKRGQRGVAK